MSANPPSTPVSTTKSSALSRVLDLVPKGYERYIRGETPAHKIQAMAEKFHQRYGIANSRAKNLTHKKHGLANARLVIYWPEYAPVADASPDSMVSWLLLVTKGIGLVTDEERLLSLIESKQRLHWLGYELVRLPKRNGTSWTWRRPKAEMTEWHATLNAAISRGHTTEVTKILQMLARQPGFAGVREQTQALFLHARRKGYEEKHPPIYTMYKIGHGLPLKVVQ